LPVEKCRIIPYQLYRSENPNTRLKFNRQNPK
jgi:hypothetical protein